MARSTAALGDEQRASIAAGLDRTRATARAFEVINQHGPLSRAELRRRLAVGLSTVTNAVQELVEQGVVREAGQAASTGGRPPRLLDLAPGLGGILAVDIGGSNLRFAAADLRGSLLYNATVPTARGDGLSLGDTVLEGLEIALTHLDGPTRAVGVSIAGIVDPATRAIAHVDNVPGWRQGDDLSWLRPLGGRLLVDNEANLGALGEQRARGGDEDMLFVAVGAGIGSGLILGGSLYRGATGAAGEIGLMRHGPGQTEELEHVAAAQGLIDAYVRHGGAASARAEEIISRAERGERSALAALDTVLDALAVGIANAVVVLNPPVVVLGGGFAQSEACVIAPLRERIHALVPSPPLVVRGKLGAEAALIGAVEWAARVAEADIVSDLQYGGLVRA